MEKRSSAEKILTRIIAAYGRIDALKDKKALVAMDYLRISYNGQERYIDAKDILMRTLRVWETLDNKEITDQYSCCSSLKMVLENSGEIPELTGMAVHAHDG